MEDEKRSRFLILQRENGMGATVVKLANWETGSV